MAGFRTSPCGDSFEALDQRAIFVESLTAEAWIALHPRVAVHQIAPLLNRAREEASTERTVGYEIDSQLAPAGRIPASTCRSQSEYSVCSAAIGCTLCARRMVAGDASERPRFSLAGLDEPGHRADCIFNRNFAIHSMLAVKIDVIHA